MTPATSAPLTLRSILLPIGEATEITPVVIPDPARDGIDIADLPTALMGLDGEGA